jgi:P4 family phage/plasmid primase-like protien
MIDPTDFRALLRAIGRDGDTIRFCRGGANSFKAFPVRFDQIEGALDIVENLGENAWFEVQPSSFNKAFGRSSEEHIVALRAIYADIDFKGGEASRPGMGDEAAALDLVDQLSSALGVPPVAVVYSGHGVQPYWPIEGGDIDSRNGGDVKGLLKRFGVLVATFAQASGGHVDNVFDLPRILRVPGPDNVKDPDNPERTKVEFSRDNLPITIEELSGILDDYEIPVPEDVELAVTGMVSPVTEWDWAEQDCQFHAQALEEIRSSTPTSRHQWMLKWSALIHGMIRYGCVTEDGFLEARRVLEERTTWLCANQEPTRPFSSREFADGLTYGIGAVQKWSKQKLAAEMRQHAHYDAVEQMVPASQPVQVQQDTAPVISITTGQPVAQPGSTTAPTTGPAVTGNLALSLAPKSIERLRTAAYSDAGNAETLSAALSGRYIHVPGIGWHTWVDGCYQADAANTVMETAKDVFFAMSRDSDPDRAKWGRKSLGLGPLRASLELAKSLPKVNVSILDLDGNGMDLVTPGGIVNLRDATIRPGDPLADFNTLSTGVTPQFDMAIPLFRQFLLETLGTKEKIDYMQRIAGLACIGEVLHHVFPMWIGPGGNGKTVLAALFSRALGSYAVILPPKFLVSGNEPHPEAIIRLRGKRWAVASEVPQGARFEEDLVKQISGEQTLIGRYMRENSVEFKNSVLMCLLANHLPSVPAGGGGFWRRTRKIDFTNIVKAADVNPRLIEQLLEHEGPGILAWMIQGARNVLADGRLNDPAEVMMSTYEYEMEEDYIGRFLRETVVAEEGMTVDRGALYSQYRQWATTTGLNPINGIKFGREVITAFPGANLGGGRVFRGIRQLPTKVTYEKENYDAME